MRIERDQSFAEHPKSDRYLKLLNGGSVASVRMDQGLASASTAAGKLGNAVKGSWKASRERKKTQRGIEKGDIQDLS